MNGIYRITSRIRSEAEAESKAAIAEAWCEVDDMLKDYEQEAIRQAEETARRGIFQAEEHHNRREAAAELEARKKVLEAKQEMVDLAFSLVPKAIYDLPDEGYIEYLARLAVRHSHTGTEQIVLGEEDLGLYGMAVIDAANALLVSEGKPAGFSLADETADIYGGLILRDGDVDVNCSIETILHFIREDISGEVADILFG